MPFLDVDAPPGGVTRARVPVAQLADGSDAVLPVVVIRGPVDGPTAYLQAGVHGDEVTGIDVCRRVLAAIDPTDVRGRIVGVPVANVPAYRDRRRSFVQEERGPIDMNRVFPGDPCGLLTERVAATLVSELLAHADYAIDFHSALAGCDISPCAYVSSEPGTALRARQEALADALAFGLTCLQDGVTAMGHTDLSRSFSAAAERLGIPAVIAELGESGRITSHRLRTGVDGTLRALVAQGSLEADAAPAPAPSRRFRRIAFVHAERGGMVEHLLDLGRPVRAEEPLARIVDPVTAEEELVLSPVDGIVLRQLTLGTCNVGAELVWVAHQLEGAP